jgi:hypothetical protein
MAKIPDDVGDIWVERIVIRDQETPTIFFHSFYPGEKRIEQPPMGAVTVIYL